MVEGGEVVLPDPDNTESALETLAPDVSTAEGDVGVAGLESFCALLFCEGDDEDEAAAICESGDLLGDSTDEDNRSDSCNLCEFATWIVPGDVTAPLPTDETGDDTAVVLETAVLNNPVPEDAVPAVVVLGGVV